MSAKDDLRELEKSVTYPANQTYDPVTLQPRNEVTQRRIAILERNMPHLCAGGTSLLDVVCSKGLISLWLRDRYGAIYGYEAGQHACRIAEAVRAYHGLDHIRFANVPFRRIPLTKTRRGEVGVWGRVGGHNRGQLAGRMDFLEGIGRIKG